MDMFQDQGSIATRLGPEAAAKDQNINRSKHTQSQTHFQWWACCFIDYSKPQLLKVQIVVMEPKLCYSQAQWKTISSSSMVINGTGSKQGLLMTFTSSTQDLVRQWGLSAALSERYCQQQQG